MHVVDVLFNMPTHKNILYTHNIPNVVNTVGMLAVEYNVHMLQTDSQLVKLDILTFSSVTRLSTQVPKCSALLRG